MGIIDYTNSSTYVMKGALGITQEHNAWNGQSLELLLWKWNGNER